MTLREQMERDLDAFYHPDEFGRTAVLGYNGTEYAVTLLPGDTAQGKRERYRDDYEASVYEVDRVISVRRCEFPVRPKQGRQITIDGEQYMIQAVSEPEGEWRLELMRYAE